MMLDSMPPVDQPDQPGQDRDELNRIASLSDEADRLLESFRARHRLELTGPAMSALGRAHISLTFVPRELRIAADHLKLT